MRTRGLAATLVGVLFVVACTDGQRTDVDPVVATPGIDVPSGNSAGSETHPTASLPAGVTVSRPPSSSVKEKAVDHARGADDLVIKLDSTGGYWDSEFELVDLPTLTAFGDGSIYRPVASDLQPNAGNFGYQNANQLSIISKAVLPPAELQRLLQLAADLDLLQSGLRFGGQETDAGDIVVQINLSGRSAKHQFMFSGDPANDPGSKEAELRNRSNIEEFIAQVIAASSRGAEAMVPEAIIVNRMDPSDPYAKPDSFGPPDTQAWPIDTVPPKLKKGQTRSCVVIEGEEVAPLLAALAKAKVTTAWKTPDGTMDWVQFRPSFPGGSNGC